KKTREWQGHRNGADHRGKPVGAGVYRFKAMMDDKSKAGGILTLPFTVQAEQAGLKSLGRTVDLLGPYQAAGAFTQRAWAQANGPALERYLAAYIEAVRWVRDPANKAEATAILIDKLKLDPAAAARTYELLID